MCGVGGKAGLCGKAVVWVRRVVGEGCVVWVGGKGGGGRLCGVGGMITGSCRQNTRREATEKQHSTRNKSQPEGNFCYPSTAVESEKEET